MWRAGKLNWKFLLYIVFVIVAVSFWAFKVASFKVVVFVGSLLFTFHFLFDEFELQEEKKNLHNILSSVNPAILVILFLLNDFLSLGISFNIFAIIAGSLFLVEILLFKEVNWFFIQTKILTLFVLTAIYIGKATTFVFSIFLLAHYFFWFIYPVYKLHKYKREERDGFIMALILLVMSSLFIYSSRIWTEVDDLGEIATRGFYVASTIHILTTAPFAYYFGLARPKKYESS